MPVKTLFLAATFVASSTSAFAAPFTGLVVFGDSTSDNGNLTAIVDGIVPGPGPLVPAPPFALGRASDGPVAVEYLSLALGLGPLLPAALPGGTNFAVIGAATGSVPLPAGGTADNIAATPGNLPPGVTLPPTGMSTAQLARFFQANPAIGPNALFVIWGGANDLLINPSVPVAVQAAANIGMMIDALYQSAGARNFLIPNLPDLALTPGLQGSDAASALTGAFNAALAAQIAIRPHISITPFNTFSLFDMVSDSPGTYGLINVEDECYQGPILGFGGGMRTVCQAPSSFLFWDQTHPSTAAHALLGAALADAVEPLAVPEPATLTLAGLGVAGLLRRRRRAA